MSINKYILVLVAALPLCSFGQKISDFETKDYASLSVYDDWVSSPFRTGALEGNVAVIDNHKKDDANNSDKILAFQCSQYGSHFYGARIQLQTPFELIPTTQYIHLFINKPTTGRVAVLGLGKRLDRPGQSPEVVQFYTNANGRVVPNEWCDMVFPVKGNGGVMIYALVIVPEAESPHRRTEDFMAYIDNVELTTEAAPRIALDYAVNFNETAQLKRTDRKVNKIAFTGNKGGHLEVAVPTTDKLLYRNLTRQAVGFAVPGEKITPTIDYRGNRMHGYVYIDNNNNAKFDVNLADNGVPTATSDLLAYSYYQGKNSVGNSLSNATPGWNPPALIIPENMVPGIYRMRYKVDWDNIDAGGNVGGNNHIVNNGGGIIDVLLNVHKQTSHVKIATRNGDVLRSDRSIFTESDIPFGQAVTIILKPENGFKHNGVIVRHGYLDKPEYVNGNRQWQVDTIPASAFVNGRYTLPAAMIDGDLEIIAEFAENKKLK